MKQIVAWREIEVTTVNGFALQVITTYSSFNKAEIDELKQIIIDNIGTALVIENEHVGGKYEERQIL